jgi:hypothetical protein
VQAVALGWLVGDLTLAHVHWLNDTYDVVPAPHGTEARLHHLKPHLTTKHCTASLITFSLRLSCVLLVPLAVWRKQWIFWTFAFATLAQLLHSMSHRETPPTWYKALCMAGLAHTRAQHDEKHHCHPGNVFSVHSSYTNRVLDGLGYWRLLETLVESAFGLKPRQQSDQLVVSRPRLAAEHSVGAVPGLQGVLPGRHHNRHRLQCNPRLFGDAGNGKRMEQRLPTSDEVIGHIVAMHLPRVASDEVAGRPA